MAVNPHPSPPRAASASGSSAPEPTSPGWASAGLEATSTMLDGLRPRAGTDAGARDMAGRLEDARDELRAADDELRAQRDALDEVDAAATLGRSRRWRMRSMIPIAMVTTDRSGLVVRANPAAGDRLNVAVDTLVRKPMLAFVHPDDRRAIRTALEAVHEPLRIGVRLQPRGAEPRPVELVIAAEASSELLDWTLLDADGSAAASDLALTRGLADVCALAVSSTERHELVAAFAHAALRGLHGAESASIALGGVDAPTAVGYAGEAGSRLDALQLRCGDGPALLAERSADAVASDDLTADPRWPQLARLAAAAGVRSVLSVPLLADAEHVGVLTATSAEVRAFGPGQRDAAGVLAAAIGAVLGGVLQRERLSSLAENLDRALLSRQEIDEAKGIVMAERGCSPEEAFAYLAELSQRENVKLRVLAHRVVTQAGLPAGPAPAGGHPWVSRRRS